ncbi:MAG: cytochrome c peroxidase [Pseudohongiellaceae bacterium]|jgi:cytochrome c peroxidase
MVSHRFRNSVAFAALIAVAGFSSPVAAQADAPMPNPPEFPDENPMLVDQDILGKFLFWEEQMSGDNTMACGTCHIHEAGGSDPRSVSTVNPGPDGLFGTDDDIHGSAGLVRFDASNTFVDGGLFGHNAQVTGRKTPTSINSVYFNDLFWDGRATQAFTDPQTGLVEIPYLGALESQAVGPPLSEVEMSSVGRDWNDIVAKLTIATPGKLMINMPPEMLDFLSDNPTYPDMFEAVYGDSALSSKRIAFAIANYERTLISDETVLDDFLRGIISVFPAGPLADGFDLFQGDANCASCHTLPFTMDNDYHNVGVRPDAEDTGRMDFTGDPGDMARFKTPNIRNSKLRLPLFHNGGKNSVREVIELYSIGGDFIGPNIDDELLVLNLTETDIVNLVALVEDGMTDARVENALFPFTRPMLTSEFPSLNSTYGVVSGAGDVLGHLPAFPGNSDFTMGVGNATANAPALMLLSFLPDPAGTVFGDPRFPVPINLDLNTLVLDVSTVTDVDGYASFNLPVPGNAVLSGLKFYSQWFIFDAAATATGGVYGTEGLEVEVL